MAGLTVISLVGYQGSGKTTLGQILAKQLGIPRVETSDVVKDLSGLQDKAELTTTAAMTKHDPDWLGRAVYNRLLAVVSGMAPNAVVLTGTREFEVHLFLAEKGVKLYTFEITSMPYWRYERLRTLSKVASAKEFIEQDLRERAMGLNETCDKAPFVIDTSPHSEPEEIVNHMISILAKNKAKI